jgi:hypothetical protein
MTATARTPTAAAPTSTATAYPAKDETGAVLDCDDTKFLVHPGAPDACGNGVDDDCSGGDLDCDDVDGDRDGFTPRAGDCDDTRPLAYPGAREVCGNDDDEDCSGEDLDCDLADEDGDGFAVVAGGPLPGGDCDDEDRFTNPFGREVCGNDDDEDCDGEALECRFADRDGDGYAEEARAGGLPGGDCDDTDRFVNPLAREVCGNEDDEDCDGEALECRFADRDGDGYAEEARTGGFPGGDCDDANRFVNPLAREVCGNAADEDCDGEALECRFADQDGDGYAPEARAEGIPGGDCDDANGRVRPGAVELCENGVDEDCAPEPPGWAAAGDAQDRLCAEHADQDGDGFAPSGGAGLPHPGGDCDDRSPGVFPGATEACDFVDNDCNGTIDDVPGCDHLGHKGQDYSPAANDGFTETVQVYEYSVGGSFYTRLGLRGVHFRIGTFTVAAGKEVGPVPVDAQGSGGSLEIRAQNVVVAGKLNADGAGWGGGAGGAGYKCPASIGQPGKGRRGGQDGQGFAGGASTTSGGKGGGPLGGVSLATGGTYLGLDGKYGVIAMGDTTTGQEVYLGSGGGGSGPTLTSPLCSNGVYTHIGGMAGGAGGGRVVIRADSGIAVASGGSVSADGFNSSITNAVYEGSGVNSDSVPATSGSGAGRGGGGGILMLCRGEGGCLAIDGAVTARPDGTVKLFCPGCGAFAPTRITAKRRCGGEIGGACGELFDKIIVDITGGWGDGATITELQVLDSSGNAIPYTTTSTDAWDSKKAGLPTYWNSTGCGSTGTCWSRLNLNNDLVSYTDAASGEASTTRFDCNATNCFVRFLVQLPSFAPVSGVKLWFGSPEGRIPSDVKLYGVSSSYTFSAQIQYRISFDLTYIGRLTGASNMTSVTQAVSTP